MSGIKDYSTAPASNTALFPEGMAPSAVNDGMRQVQADLRAWYNDAQWIVYGDGDAAFATAYVSPTSFAVSGANVTAVYHPGRRVKASGTLTGTIYGTITGASFATNTTVTVAWDSGALQNETLLVAIGILSAADGAMPPASETAAGAVQLASSAETGEGSATSKAVTPAALAAAEMIWTGPHTFRSTDAGTGEAVAIDLDRASATPAANDLLMALRWTMRDSGGGTDVAAKLVAKLLDATAGNEDAELGFHSLVSGGLAERMTLGQGLKVGSPTGGDPGFGKINATDVQINGNTVLTNSATQAELESASSTSVFTSPGRQHFHPLSAKVEGAINGNAVPADTVRDTNIASVTDSGTGRYVVNFAVTFSAANRSFTNGCRGVSSPNPCVASLEDGSTYSTTAGDFRIEDLAGAPRDVNPVCLEFYGEL